MSQLYKTMIIDDEELARARLKEMVSGYPDVFQIIGEAENGEDGLEKTERHKPDLIFLDVQMPGLNGFEMLKKLSHVPIVVFTTAFEEYAIRAFEQNSIDYLLKPIEKERLEVTVERLKRLKNVDHSGDTEKLLELIGQMKPRKAINAVPVKVGDKIFLVKLSDVVYFEAKENYVFIHTTEGKEHLIDFTLTELETKLPSQFSRLHRAYIINTEKIKVIKKYFDGRFVIAMDDKVNSEIISGSSYTQKVKKLFEI